MARNLYFPRLYKVEIERGSSHPEFGKFLTNVSSRNGKAPDFGGITKVAVVKDVVDPITLKGILTEKIRRKGDVTVEEITTESLKGSHRPYLDLVEYFSRYDDFRNIDP